MNNKILILVLFAFQFIPADIIPPNTHYISQRGLIENLSTLPGATFIIENWSSKYLITRMSIPPQTVQPDSFFRLSASSNGSNWQVLKIKKPTQADTLAIRFSIDPDLVYDSTHLDSLRYQFRLYVLPTDSLCIGVAQKTLIFNNGNPPQVLTYSLPDAAEQSAPATAGKILLSFDANVLTYSLPKQQPAVISIVTIQGRTIKTIRVAPAKSGNQLLPKLAAGTYLVKLKTPDSEASLKIAVPR